MTTDAAPTIAPHDPRRTQLARVVFLCFLGLAIAAWVAIAIAGNTRTPGIVGLITAIFGGACVALLIAAVGGWAALTLAAPAKPVDTQPALMGAGELDPQFFAVLNELETYRLQIARQVAERTAWMAPLGATIGLGVWVLTILFGDGGGVMDFLSFLIIGALMGYMLAQQKLAAKYRALYQQRVLPRLAATFGDVTWRPAVMPDLTHLKAEHLFHDFGEASAENEIAGTYHGLPISIVELKLANKNPKNHTPVFDGLLVTVTLKRDTGATTAVVADGGAFGNFRDRMLSNGRQRIALEDPEFERMYEVYGTDQIAARALLHPAFMEKLKSLGHRTGFERPLALCAGNRLTIALPKTDGRALFAVPSFNKPAASRDALTKLRADLAEVLGAADAVINLDHRFAVAPLA